MSRGHTGNGVYATGESHLLKGPLKAWAKDGTLRGHVFCHGRTFDAFLASDYARPGSPPLVNRIATKYPVLSTDQGGTTHWGGATCMARMADTVTYLQGTWGAKAGTVNLFGESMGALAALNYTKANPTKVGCIALVIPALDMNDFTATYGAEITAQYSGGYSDATYGATSNPMVYAASITTPIKIWYSSDDTTALPATIASFAAACPGVVSSTSVGALGHTDAAAAAINLDDLMAFYDAHA